MAFEWRADNSPFNQYLRHGTPLAPAAQRGLELFYGMAVVPPAIPACSRPTVAFTPLP